MFIVLISIAVQVLVLELQARFARVWPAAPASACAQLPCEGTSQSQFLNNYNLANTETPKTPSTTYHVGQTSRIPISIWHPKEVQVEGGQGRLLHQWRAPDSCTCCCGTPSLRTSRSDPWVRLSRMDRSSGDIQLISVEIFSLCMMQAV